MVNSVHAHVCTHVCMYAHVCGDERILNALYCSPLFPWDQVFSWTWNPLFLPISQADVQQPQQSSLQPFPPRPRWQPFRVSPTFLHESWDLNLGPRLVQQEPLPTEIIPVILLNSQTGIITYFLLTLMPSDNTIHFVCSAYSLGNSQ